jgi:hypothetical protein
MRRKRKGIRGWIRAAIVESIGIGLCLLLLGARATEERPDVNPSGSGFMSTILGGDAQTRASEQATWISRLVADLSSLSWSLVDTLAPDTKSGV